MAELGPVLVTGSSRGIGKATCERLVRAGHVVYASARDTSSLEELRALGCIPVRLDVTDESSMKEALSVIEQRSGQLGALVNNAGYGLYGPLEQVSLDEVREEFETNVFGLVRLTQLVLPQMREQHKGRIVNVSSVAGRATFPGGACYHASKFALEALSDALRIEVAPFGIKVVLVEPGLVRTDWASNAASSIPLDQSDNSADNEDPYALFKIAITSMLYGREQGAMRHSTLTADKIAQVIEHSLTTPSPRARYVVGLPAKALIAMRKMLPDAGYDAVMRKVFRLP